MRISAEGVRSFCGTCHVIARPRLQQVDEGAFSLDFHLIAQA